MSTVFVTNREEIRGREGLPLDGSFTAAAIAVGRASPSQESDYQIF
jgi:hypothetical protein